jgi:hypothetical protein
MTGGDSKPLRGKCRASPHARSADEARGTSIVVEAPSSTRGALDALGRSLAGQPFQLSRLLQDALLQEEGWYHWLRLLALAAIWRTADGPYATTQATEGSQGC